MDKRHAHQLLDPGQFAAVGRLLDVMVGPETHADVTEADARRYEEGQEWFAGCGGKGIPMEEVFADFGLTPDDFPLKR